MEFEPESRERGWELPSLGGRRGPKGRGIRRRAFGRSRTRGLSDDNPGEWDPVHVLRVPVRPVA